MNSTLSILELHNVGMAKMKKGQSTNHTSHITSLHAILIKRGLT